LSSNYTAANKFHQAVVTYSVLDVQSDVVDYEGLLLLGQLQLHLLQDEEHAVLQGLHSFVLVAQEEEGVVEALDADVDGRRGPVRGHKVHF